MKRERVEQNNVCYSSVLSLRERHVVAAMCSAIRVDVFPSSCDTHRAIPVNNPVCLS